MSDDDPWADVFARAEGKTTTTSSSSFFTPQSLQPQEQQEAPLAAASQNLKKKRKRKENQSWTVSWQDHLEERSKYSTMSQLLSTRDNISLGGSLLRLKNDGGGGGCCCCTGWKPGGGGGGESGSNKTTCGSCGMSSFYHLASSKNRTGSLYMDLFWILRNIRCSSILCILKKKLKQEQVHWKQHQICLEKWLNKGGSGSQNRRLWSSLETPCQELIQNLARLSSHQQKQNNRSRLILLLDIIIFCDRCYYEIYYHDLTSQAKSAEFIPHPTVYFGEVLESGELEQFTQTHSLLENIHPSVRRYYCNYHDSSSSNDSKNHCDLTTVDALTALHRIRFLETLVLFQQVFSVEQKSNDTIPKASWLTANNNNNNDNSQLAVHETPAPPVLSRWRDSCRDHLTHFYGYATLPPVLIRAILDFAKGSTIVELGAGTGYLAHLLRQSSATTTTMIRALDVAPTSESHNKNEYHADTPAFTRVEWGTVETLRQILSKHNNNAKSNPYILLLAYPPPDSEMAYQAIRTFVNECGGSKCRFIHVGEYQGLTGTRRFEQFLAQHGTLQQPLLPCPTWGTDAASVSFWTLQDSSTTNNNKPDPPTKRSMMLLQCEQCYQTKLGGQNNNTNKRLRILRHLQFCSSKCWKEYRLSSSSLQDHLRCSSLLPHVNAELLDFDDPLHFF